MKYAYLDTLIVRVFVTLSFCLCFSSCVDAPITAAHIQANGQLVSNLQASNIRPNEANTERTQIAETPQIYGLLSTSPRTTQPDSNWAELPSTKWSDLHPTLDARGNDNKNAISSPGMSPSLVFPTRSQKNQSMEVFLHLRSFGLKESRAVNFVWSHGDFQTQSPGKVEASADFSLASKQRIRPDQTGTWRVEVFARGYDGASLIFAQNFVIVDS